jgi:hypothetical protein
MHIDENLSKYLQISHIFTSMKDVLQENETCLHGLNDSAQKTQDKILYKLENKINLMNKYSSLNT